ncbi:hypothetical protein [Nonomuraea sp. LPB2021202275-12-8]|uniref:hypothetical protein n=1 Tax=Nonomuraea sp. LPB2021202275-12-8 TaxID=3120159 RepID=UPI00300C00C5
MARREGRHAIADELGRQTTGSLWHDLALERRQFARTGALVGIAFFFRALREPEPAADVHEGVGRATEATEATAIVDYQLARLAG